MLSAHFSSFLVLLRFVLTTIVFGTPLNSAKSLAIPPTPTLQFNFSNYLDSISNVISSLFHPTSITYRINNAGTLSPDRDLFPYLLESYTHTLMIMICAFLIAVLLSTTFTILTFYFPRRIQSLILKTLHVLESLPDLFFVVSVQLFVILIYKIQIYSLPFPFLLCKKNIFVTDSNVKYITNYFLIQNQPTKL